MKRFSRLVCLIMTVVFVFMLIPIANAASKITLKSGAAAPSTIYAGHTYNLKVAGVKVKFASSNKKVATIGATTGKMKAAAPGTVKITAKNAKSGKAVASKTFKVLQRAKSVTADSEVYLDAVGDTTTLKATKIPETSTDVIRFVTGDKTIVTVGATSGKITAVKEGKTTINVYAKATKATANSNKNNKVATVRVYVGAYLDHAYSTEYAQNSIHVKFKTDCTSRKFAPADFTVTNKETSVVEAVKEVKLLGTKDLNLLLYNELIPGKVYTLKYGESTVEFTAGSPSPEGDEEAVTPAQLVLSDPTLSMWINDDSVEENEEGEEVTKSDPENKTTVSVSASASLRNIYRETVPADPKQISIQLKHAPGSSAPKTTVAADPSQTGAIRITFWETPDLQQGSYIYQVDYKTSAGKEETTLQGLLVLNVVNMGTSGFEPETSTVSFYDQEGSNLVLLASYTLEAGSMVPWYNPVQKKGMTCSWTWFRDDAEEGEEGEQGGQGQQIETPSIVPEYNIYAVAQWNKNHTVTFVDEDGTKISSAEYVYGTAAEDIAKPADPTKAATARYTYTFAGWSPAIAKVTGDATYIATYDSTVNKYTVTFVDDDGTKISSADYDYGTAAENIVQPDDPTKARTDEYTYTFAGWSPSIEIVSGNATYKATYTATKRQYIITFVDEDRTGISSAKYDYGTAAADILKPADPTKAATDEYTYTFAGWNPAIAQVTGNATYKATYTATRNSTIDKYTVTFVDENGTEISSAEYDYGTAAADIVKPADPTKAATAQYTYVFAGWSPAIAQVTGNATYKATYTGTKRQYTVTFADEDGTKISSAKYNYGTAAADIAQPADPTKAATDQYTYVFAGWSPAIAQVTGDATYKATYTGTKRQYTVTFADEDGTTISSAKYNYGTAAADIAQPDDPTKAKTDEYTYTFAGWSPAIAEVTKDATYKATYSSTVNKYAVTFVDEDGTTVLKEATAYGYGTAAADIAQPDDPTKAKTDEYTYTFAGWSPAIAEVTKDATYKATYSSTVNKYAVTFVDEDGTTVLKEATAYDYGTAADNIVKPDDPTKAKTDEYTYTFAGWNPAIAKVIEDAIYKATYTGAKRQYTVTFVDEDGTTVLKEATAYDYGTAADKVEKPADPTKAATAQYTYAFAGWNPAIAKVIEDAIYKATFTPNLRNYTITWKNDDGSVIDTTTVDYGVVPTHADVAKKADAQYTYTFADWTPTIEKVSGEATYQATFTPHLQNYTITWKNDDGSVIDTTTVDYGVVPTHADAAKKADAQYTYTFAGWTPTVEKVSGEATYQATFTPHLQSYTITWKNDDGSVTDTTTVAYGETPTHADPSKAEDAQYTYTFAGWTPTIEKVSGEATYQATFTPHLKSYTITWKNDDGSVIDTTTVDYGVVPTHADAAKAATAQYTYTFADWTPAIEKVTGNAEYYATFTPHLRSYTITWKNDDGSVIDTTTVDYGVVPTHADAAKAADAQYTYKFDDWTPTIENVNGEATYTATYKSIARCTVTFKDETGKEISSAKYDYGTAKANITVPTVASEKTVEVSAGEKTYYKFTGWKPALADVTGDATYTAVYTRAYTLTVYPYGSSYPERKYTINLVPGDTISLETPTPIEQDKVFVEWVWPSDVTITNNKMPECDVTVTAIWSAPTTTDNSFPAAAN